MKTAQSTLAEQFRQLHVKGNPLILYNAWDAGSAKVITDCGAKAIATGSWSVAAAHGYDDREKIPLNLVFENARRIVEAVNLPVTIDFEGGYAIDPGTIADHVRQLIDTGIVGINFEDQQMSGKWIFAPDDQILRIQAIRKMADVLRCPLFINARTDIFLKTPAEKHSEFFSDAVDRGKMYGDAGASGFFAPGLRDRNLIRELCSKVSLPVNILMMSDTPDTSELAKLGVARISYGPYPYRLAMNALKEAARKALGTDS